MGLAALTHHVITDMWSATRLSKPCGLSSRLPYRGSEDDEIEYQNGHAGQWCWVLRYPIVDGNADQLSEQS